MATLYKQKLESFAACIFPVSVSVAMAKFLFREAQCEDVSSENSVQEEDEEDFSDFTLQSSQESVSLQR